MSALKYLISYPMDHFSRRRWTTVSKLLSPWMVEIAMIDEYFKLLLTLCTQQVNKLNWTSGQLDRERVSALSAKQANLIRDRSIYLSVHLSIYLSVYLHEFYFLHFLFTTFSLSYFFSIFVFSEQKKVNSRNSYHTKNCYLIIINELWEENNFQEIAYIEFHLQSQLFKYL